MAGCWIAMTHAGDGCSACRAEGTAAGGTAVVGAALRAVLPAAELPLEKGLELLLDAVDGGAGAGGCCQGLA